MAKMPVSAPTGRVPAGRKRRDWWPVLMGHRQCQLVDNLEVPTINWHINCFLDPSREHSPGRKNDRLLRSPMRLLRIVYRPGAKMGTRENLRPCPQRSMFRGQYFSILHHVSANRFHLAGHDFVLTLTTLKGREELVCLRFFQWIQKVRILPTMISSGFYPIVASSDLCWRLLRSRLTGQ